MKDIIKHLMFTLLCIVFLQVSAHATITERLWENCEKIPLLISQHAPCAALISSLQDNDDIHKLDGPVYNTPKNSLGVLCEIGQSLEKMGVGTSSLPLNAVRDALTNFIDAHPHFAPHNPFLEYCHGKENLTPEKTKNFIHTFFQTLDNAYPQNIVEQGYLRSIASYAYTTAFRAFQENEEKLGAYPMQILLHRIIENFTTQGGCAQGVVNRLFCAYTTILSAIIP